MQFAQAVALGQEGGGFPAELLDGLRVIVRYGGLQVSNGGGQVALGLLQG